MVEVEVGFLNCSDVVIVGGGVVVTFWTGP